MTFGESIKTCFRKYVVFKGRASRSEYWFFVLFEFIISIGLQFIGGLVVIPLIFKGQFTPEAINRVFLPISIISIVVALAFLLPALGVMTRRFHDVNKSGWWIVIYYIFVVVWAIPVSVVYVMAFSKAAQFDDIPMALVFLASLLTILLLALEIVFLVWCCTRGTHGPNKYGSDPLEPTYVDVQLTPEQS